MPIHQNSTVAAGLFRDSQLNENNTGLGFQLMRTQQDSLAKIFWESLISGWVMLFKKDPYGNFIFHGEKHVIEEGIFEFENFLEGVAEIFAHLVRERLNFTEAELSKLTNAVKLALFVQFKFAFEDSPGSHIICYGNPVKPVTHPYDYYDFIEAAFKKFCSFI
jgi:hypothetical protein